MSVDQTKPATVGQRFAGQGGVGAFNAIAAYMLLNYAEWPPDIVVNLAILSQVGFGVLGKVFRNVGEERGWARWFA